MDPKITTREPPLSARASWAGPGLGRGCVVGLGLSGPILIFLGQKHLDLILFFEIKSVQEFEINSEFLSKLISIFEISKQFAPMSNRTKTIPNPEQVLSKIRTQTEPFKPNRSATCSNSFITYLIQKEESPIYLYIDKSLTWFYSLISSKILSAFSAFLLSYFHCEKEFKHLVYSLYK